MASLFLPSGHTNLWLSLCYSSLFLSSLYCCRALQSSSQVFTLDSLRDSLTRQEDTIVFSLIERAKYPYNPPAYDPSYLAGGGSIVELFVRETEAVQAKVGRYQNPEEVPFFPEGLPFSLLASYNYPQELYPAAASVNVSKIIWDMYFKKLLPRLVAKGDDGNYGVTSASDLVILQALSRRIHLGRFVAEVKYRDSPQDYVHAIRAKDKDTLTKLVTTKSVEEAVRRRVKKKAMVFGQNVTLESKVGETNSGGGHAKYKVEPSVVSQLYGKWVIPLTKVVEVEYLLHRLD